MKFVSLVALADQADAAAWRELAENACRQAVVLPAGQVEGLVVGEILETVEPIPEGAPYGGVVVHWWADSKTANPVPQLIEGSAYASQTRVTTWQVREHVYRRPVERLQPGVDPAGISMFGTAYRRGDFTLEEFFRYWDDIHAPISVRLPGMGGYISAEIEEHVEGDLQVDGLVELWWPSKETLDAAEQTPENEAAWADVGEYAEEKGAFWLLGSHVLIVPPDAGPGSLDDP